MLDKTFNPQEAEARLYDLWEESGAFRAGAGGRVEEGAQPYCIVIPPPNVTGSLHMGHALNNTLQDVLIRFERMRGKDVLWQPGLDHAGIATQMIVERQLEGEGNIRRRDMGREAFIERIWKWKGESGGTIIGQLRRLGASCDWSRERFTLDDGLSKAVLKVFVELYREGLIYRDKRLVNWHPELQTAVSDLEVENIEVKGHFWHFRYPLADGVTYEWPLFDEEGNPAGSETRDYIVVATTRPETMLGDTGVAVNPEDERYKPLIGKFVDLPLVGRRIPIVADEHADPGQGSGAVKITPAHDFNDFEVGKRQNLEQINILNPDGKLNDEVPEPYRGLDRFKARKKVVDDIEALGLLDRIEDKTIMVPHDEKSKMVVIEPYLTDQWYVDAATLAKPAIEAVERGETVFVPKNWEKTYFEWMRNIQPWCISRQLWWGHRIPAWYGPDGHVFVAYSDEEAAAEAEKHYGKPVDLTRDEDVLDTWFSSGLWPFSTLGWPDETPELKRYYKTDVLVTAFDIIFFWVARMMMMGMHFMKEVPFHTVYIHAIVRDEKGQKMSKTKGNVVDPLQLIDEYGADALRFTLAAMAAQGRDIKLATSRVEGYRNFGTKLWNAARFCEMNECVRVEGFDPAQVKETVNKWIVGEAARSAAEITTAIEAYRFNDAAGAAYRFVWNVFCDWYLEFIKPLLMGDDETAKAETRATAAWALDRILLMLHPFMPFVTEELWQRTGEQGPKRETMLVTAEWPVMTGLGDPASDREMDWVIRFISEVRSVRAEMNVPAGAKIELLIKDASAESLARLGRHRSLIDRLARLSSVETATDIPHGAIQLVLDEATLILPLASLIDVDAETARLRKELGKLEDEVKKIDAKLGNAKFLAGAPEHVVEEQRERKSDAQAAMAKFSDALKRLEGAA
ncbi:valine--tRNA ligase [Parvibaculum sp.]|uniref:valine--tRNA ligase n=1 Tax=Parvibaculum sp. TaxID=2024848 RepID=UPI001AFF1F3F|nr:valine--tRNA ligase [Parvibaculum sp.]MBO6634847.1 valine--tRNA ligase [Parvibaculum sp.]MBO6680329.1 valine--tRNA ligase [Parvibaculum sp.]MBO6686455.1 valine--tRNA ligase [Parvibaculum sp.]